jgi:hypothetical protein
MSDKKPQSKIQLIVSDEANPKIDVPPSKRMQVVGVSLVHPNLSKAKVTAARLCGSTSDCQALFEAGE